MAVPHPEEVLQRVERLAKKGLPAVTIVTGTNDFFRREAVDLLLGAIPSDAELRVLDAVEVRGVADRGDDDDDDGDGGAESGPDIGADGGLGGCPELVDLRGGGLFARRAFLCVRRAKNWWTRHAATLVDQAPKFGAGCGVIVEAPQLNRRKRAVAAFVKEWADHGSVFEFRDLWELPYDRSRGPLEGELARWVAHRGSRLGVPLTPEAAWMIVARVSKQPAELVAELARLRDVLGEERNRPPLGPADLKEHLTIGFESTPFEFAEAVLAGDRRRAQRSVHAMFARGIRGRDGRAIDQGGLFPFVTNWLYLSLARAYEGRALLDEGVSVRDLPGRVGIRQFGDRFVAEVKKNDAARLRHGLLALNHCQRMMRLSAEDPEIVLEQFLSHWFDGAPVPRARDLEA
ncbi:MAG: hypothetical protein KDE27_21625 [Planctomycetes bacterium]|nr:hypothetical protein [Planctomycetota bacterium]